MKQRIDEMMRDYEVKQEEPCDAELSELEKRRIISMALAKAGLDQNAGDRSHPEMQTVRDGEETEEEREMGDRMNQDIERENVRRKKRPRKRILAVCVAAVLVFGAIGVSAATGLSDRLINFLKPANDKQIELIGKAGSVIDKEVTDNGATLRILESVGDRTAVYVMFDLIGPEGMVFDKDSYSFETAYFMTDNSSVGYSFEQLDDDNPSDNKLSFVMQADSGEGFAGTDVTLWLKDLRYYDIGAGDYIKAMEGEWKVPFKLDYKDVSETYKANETAEVFGEPCDITEITISPLSVSATLKGEGVRKYDEGDIGDHPELYEMKPFTIQMKDGTVLDSAKSWGAGSEKDKMTQTCLYGEMIDVDQIESVTVYGTKIPIE